MTKTIIILFFIFKLSAVYAAKQFAAHKVTYSKTLSGNLQKIDSFFSNTNTHQIKTPTSSETPLSLMDRIFTQEQGKFVLVTTKLKPHNVELDVIYRDGDSYLFHTEDYAIYFISYSEAEVQIIINGLDLKKKVVRFISNLLITEAHAEESCIPHDESGLTALWNTTKMIGSEYLYPGMARVISCVANLPVGAFEGLYDSTLGVPVALGKLAWNAPEVGGAVWRASKFMVQHSSEIAQIASAWFSKNVDKFHDLSPWQQGELICKTMAKLTAMGVVTAWTFGIGGAKLAVQIGETLAKFGKAGEIAALMSEYGVKVVQAGQNMIPTAEAANAGLKATLLVKAAEATQATGTAMQATAPKVGAVAEVIGKAPVVGKATEKTGEALAKFGHNRVTKLTINDAEKSFKNFQEAAKKNNRPVMEAEMNNLKAQRDEALRSNDKIAEEAIVKKIDEAQNIMVPELEKLTSLQTSYKFQMGEMIPLAENYQTSQFGTSTIISDMEGLAYRAREALDAIKRAEELGLPIDGKALREKVTAQVKAELKNLDDEMANTLAAAKNKKVTNPNLPLNPIVWAFDKVQQDVSLLFAELLPDGFRPKYKEINVHEALTPAPAVAAEAPVKGGLRVIKGGKGQKPAPIPDETPRPKIDKTEKVSRSFPVHKKQIRDFVDGAQKSASDSNEALSRLEQAVKNGNAADAAKELEHIEANFRKIKSDNIKLYNLVDEHRDDIKDFDFYDHFDVHKNEAEAILKKAKEIKNGQE